MRKLIHVQVVTIIVSQLCTIEYLISFIFFYLSFHWNFSYGKSIISFLVLKVGIRRTFRFWFKPTRFTPQSDLPREVPAEPTQSILGFFKFRHRGFRWNIRYIYYYNNSIHID